MSEFSHQLEYHQIEFIYRAIQDAMGGETGNLCEALSLVMDLRESHCEPEVGETR